MRRRGNGRRSVEERGGGRKWGGEDYIHVWDPFCRGDLQNACGKKRTNMRSAVGQNAVPLLRLHQEKAVCPIRCRGDKLK